MKVNSYEQSILDERFSDELHSLVRSAGSPFSEQAEAAGLCPLTDFQNADLRAIDLSDSDIRGFNFKGSDLGGAVGIRIRWDETTIFADANLDGSVFASRDRVAKYLSKQPTSRDQLARLMRIDDNGKIIWAADNLSLRSSRAPEDALRLVEAMFLAANGAFLKSQLLFFMAPRVGREMLTELIVDVISTYSSSGAIIQSALQVIVRSRLSSTETVRQAMFGLLRSSNPQVREATLSALMRTDPTAMDMAAIRRVVDEHPPLGRIYVAECARRRGERYEIVVRDPFTNTPFGVAEDVDQTTLGGIVSRWERVNAVGDQDSHLSLIARTGNSNYRISNRQRTTRSAEIVRMWTELRQDGIDIRPV